MTSPPARPSYRARQLLALGLSLLVLVGAGAGVVALISHLFSRTPPPPEVCVATTALGSATVTHEQAANAALIAGLAMREGLGTRAATIALATAFQESRLVNLAHGDRDSLGLFQQRPSQGWGTVAQIMDPYYATTRFYAELVKFDDWQTGDINDVAQEVQRSGVPDGYRQHVTSATILAEVLTGFAPAGLSCIDRQQLPGDASALAETYTKTLGATATPAGSTLTLKAANPPQAWRYALQAVANGQQVGVVSVAIGTRAWAPGSTAQGEWTTATAPLGATTVVVTLRG